MSSLMDGLDLHDLHFPHVAALCRQDLHEKEGARSIRGAFGWVSMEGFSVREVKKTPREQTNWIWKGRSL